MRKMVSPSNGFEQRRAEVLTTGTQAYTTSTQPFTGGCWRWPQLSQSGNDESNPVSKLFEGLGDALRLVSAHCGPTEGGLTRAELRELSNANVRSLSGDLSELALEYAWNELAIATGGFSDSRRLGKGAYGAVYRGTLREGIDVAVKVMTAPLGGGFEDEVRLLSRCRHPNVVMLLGFALHSEEAGCRRALVYELLPGGDAHARLQSKEAIYGWSERVRTTIDVARGLAHLHKHRPEVFHRDIKTANILFGADGMAKIADFGLACCSRGRRLGAANSCPEALMVEVVAGTPGYADPQYAQTGVVTEAAEVYSFGVVVVELLTGLPPAMNQRDGLGLVFPHEELHLHLDGAKSRVLRRLDSRAEWPLVSAAGLTTLALLCIHEDASRRPSLLEAVALLQDLSAAANEAASSSSSPSVEAASASGSGLTTEPSSVRGTGLEAVRPLHAGGGSAGVVVAAHGAAPAGPWRCRDPGPHGSHVVFGSEVHPAGVSVVNHGSHTGLRSAAVRPPRRVIIEASPMQVQCLEQFGTPQQVQNALPEAYVGPTPQRSASAAAYCRRPTPVSALPRAASRGSVRGPEPSAIAAHASGLDLREFRWRRASCT